MLGSHTGTWILAFDGLVHQLEPKIRDTLEWLHDHGELGSLRSIRSPLSFPMYIKG